MVEILNTNYNKYVDLIGTAHFTRRSINDVYNAINSCKPKDVAVELDWGRFRALSQVCLECPKRGSCVGICEFTSTSEALGNVDANIWLIDMTEREMGQRIRSRITPYEIYNMHVPAYHHADENPVWLWEKGYKEKVVYDSKMQIEAQRRVFPSVWSVLIDERNTLMAARLAWLASKNINEGNKSKILTFVGAAHVDGIKDLLAEPIVIKDNLRRFDLPLTEPTRIRRVAVQEAQ
jgi:pheromone shutdown protein TraB